MATASNDQSGGGGIGGGGAAGIGQRQKEIYKYEAPWPLYSMHWAVRPGEPGIGASSSSSRRGTFRLALGSFIEEYCNRVQIVTLDEATGEFAPMSTFEHNYPPTKILFIPDQNGTYPDLIATTGDYLRIWRCVSDKETHLECLLNNNKNSDFCAPQTSFDWNELDLGMIGACSIDTTCTIWGIETGQAISQVSLSGGNQTGSARAASSSVVNGHVKTQLIAHDKEVYDMAFSLFNRDTFASVGADGSVRLFDLRHLEHSTILYEDMGSSPAGGAANAMAAGPGGRRALLRVGWNRQDQNYMATFALEAPNDAHELIVIDMRVPCTPVARLRNHRAPLNGFSWAPHSSVHLCTAGDDHQALIWDISAIPRAIEDPILAYTAAGPINQLHWSVAQSDWIAIGYGTSLEILRV